MVGLLESMAHLEGVLEETVPTFVSPYELAEIKFNSERKDQKFYVAGLSKLVKNGEDFRCLVYTFNSESIIPSFVDVRLIKSYKVLEELR
ncbi:hypothetical protein CMI38_02920 [Candidatus Pacearchaeota archaeon]|jgi:hypothetical protein|nr:hypothetical protein [Candidatus Pacearchaeota archaeon]|tara:strand:- start:276 stop:545 length:270 start_codon:yes stop_codon:yes gene_type:complete